MNGAMLSKTDYYKLAFLCITILIEDKEYNRNTISYTTTFCNLIGLEHTYTCENYKTFACSSINKYYHDLRVIFGRNTTRDISQLFQITYNNFEISLAVFMPNIITNHAITYTYTMMAKPIRALELHYPKNQFLIT